MRSGFCTHSISLMTSSASASRTSCGAISWLKRDPRSRSTTSPATPVPMSLAISSSSSSSSAAASSRRRAKIVLMPSLSRFELRDRPARSRPNQPRGSAAAGAGSGAAVGGRGRFEEGLRRRGGFRRDERIGFGRLEGGRRRFLRPRVPIRHRVRRFLVPPARAAMALVW